ncbi:MBL fold metallo-hydrolase [Arthrobacter sp. JUb115]|uniref:MBL fold metallo-hydrolase n=1 Tax=Arthrobacter sp. JUb115 TaxID=2485108 RepID=UPI00105F4504|nr:MBL fold metallo-hydrolase [Arthrobacter sp. JUb115]TDU25338.1 glyoxylase-like metal-dependent hydrolase (beta-lactamase superfamily II) [Arthrobacter sp. JUb115]
MNELLLNDVTVRWVSVSDMANNVYLVTNRKTGEQLLVDAADDMQAIERLIQAASEDASDPRIIGIATTHQHWDHVRALADAVEKYPVPTYAGADDVAGIAEESGVKIDHALNHGDQLKLGDVTIEAIHLRGHTPGSIGYALVDSSGQPVVLSGDSLFPGGVGNTWKDPQRFLSLLTDVSERIFGRFPDETKVLPGHGDSTTVGAERPNLEQWRERGW